ncbi:MAG: pectate lyase [Armatimonadota bacterium]|jgi:PelA/Pel-15E family pectate lyase
MRNIIAVIVLTLLVTPCFALNEALVDDATEAMRTAVTYLVEEVSVGGGYAGSYLADLSDQWGEGHITETMNWVQPPGSPSTGMAFMRAYEATGEQLFLDAAKRNAESLVWGQLACGGWDYNIDFTRAGEERWFYRRNIGSDDPALTSGRNVGTMDDNVTQAATQLLITVDTALEKAGQRDEQIHEATLAALDYLLEAQFDHGGWPQRFPLSGRAYNDFSTFNDNTIRDCARTMMAAWNAYGDERYRESFMRCGEFIINAQLPEPQASWAQQYDEDLRPGWARRFEPASVCSSESVGVMRLLIELAVFAEDEKFIEPLPAAMDWYERSELPEGGWARFYELKTNRPLYFYAGSYRLTYDDSDTPTHYGFKGGYYRPDIRETYDQIKQMGIAAYAAAREERREISREEQIRGAEGMEGDVRQVLDSRTENGVWLSRGGYGPDVEHLNMRTVQQRIGTLADYVGNAKGFPGR